MWYNATDTCIKILRYWIWPVSTAQSIPCVKLDDSWVSSLTDHIAVDFNDGVLCVFKTVKAIFFPVTHSSASQQDLRLSKSSNAVAHTVDSDISYAVVPNHTLTVFPNSTVKSSRGESVFDWKIIGAEIYFTTNMLLDCVKYASIAMCENAKVLPFF